MPCNQYLDRWLSILFSSFAGQLITFRTFSIGEWKWVQLWGGMLYSKLEHVVNILIAPVRNQQEHLFVSAGLDFVKKYFSGAYQRG